MIREAYLMMTTEELKKEISIMEEAIENLMEKGMERVAIELEDVLVQVEQLLSDRVEELVSWGY